MVLKSGKKKKDGAKEMGTNRKREIDKEIK